MIPFKKLTPTQRVILIFFAEKPHYVKAPQTKDFPAMALRGLVSRKLLTEWYRNTYRTTALGKEALLWDEFLTWKADKEAKEQSR